jgi:hypothetical protein
LPSLVNRGGSCAGRDGEIVTHEYLVHNDGPATITYVMVWIVDHEEEPLSTSASADVVLIRVARSG